MKRENDCVETIYPPSYRQNSCFFDCAYMALFGIDDSWINDNFLFVRIDKDFIRKYEPSLHLRANDGNDIYNVLYKKNDVNNKDIVDIIEYAKTIPKWESNENENDFIFSKKLKKKNVNKKDVKKLLSIVRNIDTKYEILFKKNLQENLCKCVKLVRNGKKIISLLDIFKKLVISNKCIPDDEEMKQTLQTSQEQSAISIIRFLFDLFYIKPIDVINTKVYTNSIEDITSELNSDERIITISKSHPIYLLQSCDFIKKDHIYSIQELISNGNSEIHTSDNGFDHNNKKYQNIIKNQKISDTNFLVIELERFIFPSCITKQFSLHEININEMININNKKLYLKSIICHFGSNCPIPISYNNTGHYIAYMRTIVDTKSNWFYYDDMPSNREGKPTFENLGSFEEMLDKHKHINKNCVVLVYTSDDGTKRNKSNEDYEWLL